MLQSIYRLFKEKKVPSVFISMSMDTYLMRNSLECKKITGFDPGEEEIFNLVKDVEVIEIGKLLKSYYHFHKGIDLEEKDIIAKEGLLLDLFSTIISMEKREFGIVPSQDFPEFIDWVIKKISLVEYFEKEDLIIRKRDPFTENEFMEWNPEKMKIIESIKREGIPLEGFKSEFIVNILRRIFLEVLPVPWGQKPKEWSLVKKMIHCT